MKVLSLFIFISILISCKNNSRKENKSVAENKVVNLLEGYEMSASDTKIVYDKLSFGNGYNSVTGKEHFGVLNYDNAAKSTEVIAGAIGNSGIVTMEIVEDRESLKKVLDINAKVDLDIKLGAFTSDNSAKVNLYRETNFSSFSQNAVLKAQYTNEPLVLLNPSVKEKWIKLAKKDPDEFMRTCGDMFVSRIYTGGSMYALYSLHERDDYEKEKNDFFLKSVNKYMGQKLDVEVDVKALTESKKKIKNINTSIITEGGSKTPDSTSLEAFVSYANAFKEQVGTDGRAIVLYVELAPYESIAGFPKDVDFNKIRIGQKEFLETCNEHYGVAEESKANAEFVLKNPMFFESFDRVKASAITPSMGLKIEQLKTLMRKCESDFNDCNPEFLEEFGSISLYNPEMDYPDFKSIDVELSVLPNKDYIEVFPDTKEGMSFSIIGKLESRLTKDNAQVNCKDVSIDYYREKVYSDLLNIKNRLGRKYIEKHYPQLILDLYEYSERPYYMVKYSDAKTKAFLREFAWDGSTTITEKNVSIAVKLVNPKSKFQLDQRYTNKSRWTDVTNDFAKHFNFKPSERYSSIRACENNAPIATIAVIETDAKGVVTTKREANDNYPKAILREGHITYEFNE